MEDLENRLAAAEESNPEIRKKKPRRKAQEIDKNFKVVTLLNLVSLWKLFKMLRIWSESEFAHQAKTQRRNQDLEIELHGKGWNCYIEAETVRGTRQRSEVFPSATVPKKHRGVIPVAKS